jgi:glycerol uptake facilitator-like aquaporin
LNIHDKGIEKYFTEALGAFFVVLVYGITGDPLAVGLTLMALVYIAESISGAHFNPAVSLAFYLKRKLTAKQLLAYLLSQLLGGFLASVVLYFLAQMAFYIDTPATTNIYQQAFSEVFFTMIFVLVMLIFSRTSIQRKNKISGLIIGLTFAGMLMVATPVSGGVLNPAISIGTALVDLINGGNSYMQVPLYTVAPLAGGTFAALLFNWLFPE